MTTSSLLAIARLSDLAEDVPVAIDADGTPLVAVRHAGNQDRIARLQAAVTIRRQNLTPSPRLLEPS